MTYTLNKAIILINEPENAELAYMIGCRKCQNGVWGAYVTEDKSTFVIVCRECGHTIAIEPNSVTEKPDEIPLDIRFFT